MRFSQSEVVSLPNLQKDNDCYQEYLGEYGPDMSLKELIFDHTAKQINIFYVFVVL